jgi:hypothetical protein
MGRIHRFLETGFQQSNVFLSRALGGQFGNTGFHDFAGVKEVHDRGVVQ